MTNGAKKETAVFDRLANELGEIKLQLRRLLLFIPEESLKRYANAREVKKAYRKAIQSFPPK